MIARSGAATLVSVLLLSGCGGGSDGEEEAGTFTGAPLEAQDPGPVHVHGLGYDSARNVLYIATHTGLFELPDGAAKATRIGDSYQDTMGFALVRPGFFLGSGHPDARENLPPHLGLIKSTDAARSWQPVSLTGDADFHVLRAQGKNVYGFDVKQERLLVSVDAGHSWAKAKVPENLVDLAVDPGNPNNLVASGGAVLYRSTDRGRSWRAITAGVTGYLAWPSRKRLYVATPDGAFFTAPGPGERWRPRRSLGGPVAALNAVDEETLFAALHDGAIKRSTDGGVTWKVRATP